MDQNDEKLIEDYLGGKEEAFESIVLRYVRPIYNFIFRFLKNREEAEELTQDVFLKIWKNLKKFDRKRKFKTWMFAIARNTIIDWMRKKKSLSFSELQNDEETSFEETLEDIEPLPDEIFERKELKERLENALEKIPSDYRAIIFLHHTEDLTFEEISEVIGKPMNTVKSQYRRGLILLRTHLT